MLPGTPGIPTAHDNKPGYLILQWEEGANGNAPIDKFELQYRKGNTHKISITTQKLLVDHSSFIIRITCFWIIEYVGLYMFWCFQVMVVWSRSVRFVRTKSGTMVRWWFISRSPWKLMTLTGFVCVPSQRLGLPVGVDGRNPSNQVVICYLLYSERLVDFSLDYHLIFLLLYSWRRTVGISTSDLFVERKELSSLFARWWTHSQYLQLTSPHILMKRVMLSVILSIMVQERGHYLVEKTFILQLWDTYYYQWYYIVFFISWHTVSATGASKPVYEEIWFIFVMIIAFLILVIAIIVCCWKCQRSKDGYSKYCKFFSN